MKILYGVVGEGMGHAMRSRVVLEHLIASGHTVEIMASGRATEFLAKRFADVNPIHGFHMILEENRIRLGKTAWSNVVNGALGVPKNIAAYFDVIEEHRPELVISDFESWTHLYAKTHGLPILSIDNMQIIHRCELPDDIVDGHRVAFQLTKAFIKSKLPFCDEYFITSFFRPPVRKPRTRLFPPILRPEILAATRQDGAHLLVYQSGPNEALQAALARTGLECRIYGMRPGITAELTEGTLRFLPFSEPGFIADLATCRAVIAGAGFTLMGEAVYLKKPMLAVPLAGQFEQQLNARYLEREGFGMFAEDLDDASILPRFLERADDCARTLAGYRQDGNREIFAAVDAFIATHAT
ncbi:MAG: teichoic acid biosynthesis protein [Proteobacteria bacterium]|nr:teichoic acid biosynthesis protein [Pseudomonadota bacterium]